MNKFAPDIKAAVETLRRGGIIVYPTDTVWGIGCDATNSEAVKRVFGLKKRADAKALITLVGSLAALERTADGIPDVAYELIECTDRPLTIVYDRPLPMAHISPELQAPDGTIGIRVTTEAFSSALCRTFGKPLVSTSANISGRPSPAVFKQIDPEIIAGVDYVCTSRRNEQPTENTKPSMVMRLSANGCFKILRS